MPMFKIDLYVHSWNEMSYPGNYPVWFIDLTIYAKLSVYISQK